MTAVVSPPPAISVRWRAGLDPLAAREEDACPVAAGGPEARRLWGVGLRLLRRVQLRQVVVGGGRGPVVVELVEAAGIARARADGPGERHRRGEQHARAVRRDRA